MCTKNLATHFSILAWEIPWTEEPGGLQSLGSQKSWTQLSTHAQGQQHCILSVSYHWAVRLALLLPGHQPVSGWPDPSAVKFSIVFENSALEKATYEPSLYDFVYTNPLRGRLPLHSWLQGQI